MTVESGYRWKERLGEVAAPARQGAHAQAMKLPRLKPAGQPAEVRAYDTDHIAEAREADARRTAEWAEIRRRIAYERRGWRRYKLPVTDALRTARRALKRVIRWVDAL